MTVQELITELGFDVDESGLAKFQAGLDRATQAARGVTLVVAGAAVAAVNFASDYVESLNKVNVAFGEELTPAILDWSKTTLTSFGIAQGTALDMIALYGDMATGMGLTQKAGAEMGKMLVGRAADLASFKNISIEVANNALKGVYTGETESLKTLGIVMTEANLKQFALDQGIKKNIKNMTQAEKVQLRYAFVMEASKNAAGDFANTSGGVANQTRLVTEGLKQAAASFGMLLLPAVTAVLQEVNKYITAFAMLDEETKKNVLTVAALVAAIYPLLKVIQLITAATKFAIAIKTGYAIATGVMTATEQTSTVAKVAAVAILWAQNAATTAMTAAQWLLNAAMSANPIGLIIIGVAALVAGFILLYNRSEKFRNIVDAIATATVNFVKMAIPAILNFGKAAFDFLVAPIRMFLDLLSKIPGMAKLAQGVKAVISGGGPGSTEPGGGAIPPTFAGGGFGGMPTGAQSSVENYEVRSSVSVQVPAGTPAAQSDFINKDVRRVVQEENQKTFKKTRQAAGKTE